MDTPGGAGPSGPVHPGGRDFAHGLSELRPRLAPPPLCLPPEVGVCSFARFSGEFLPRGPSTPDPAEVATGGPKAPLQDGGQAVCFSALGMVQCCKVGVEAWVPGAARVVGEDGGRDGGRAGGLGKLPGEAGRWSDSRTCVDSQLCCPVRTMW